MELNKRERLSLIITAILFFLTLICYNTYKFYSTSIRQDIGYLSNLIIKAKSELTYQPLKFENTDEGLSLVNEIEEKLNKIELKHGNKNSFVGNTIQKYKVKRSQKKILGLYKNREDAFEQLDQMVTSISKEESWLILNQVSNEADVPMDSVIAGCPIAEHMNNYIYNDGYEYGRVRELIMESAKIKFPNKLKVGEVGILTVIVPSVIIDTLDNFQTYEIDSIHIIPQTAGISVNLKTEYPNLKYEVEIKPTKSGTEKILISAQVNDEISKSENVPMIEIEIETDDKISSFAERNILFLIVLLVLPFYLFILQKINPNLYRAIVPISESNFKQTAEDYVKENRIRDAIDIIMKYSRNKDKEAYKTAVLYSANYTNFRKKIRNNLIGKKQEKKVRSKINYELLVLIDSL